MRTWEIGDSHYLSANVVREQDFILRIRRLQRVAEPQLVVNLAISETDAETGGRGRLEVVQERLRAWAESQGAYAAEMSNGDVFLVRKLDAKAPAWVEQALSIAWPDKLPVEKKQQVFVTYCLPKDYAALRERMEYYLGLSRRVSTENDEASPVQLLQTEAARGPLTAWSTGQIEKLLNTIDITPYLRHQPVCTRGSDGRWNQIFDECFIGFEALRLDRFPKLEMGNSSHLFLALCQALDLHLLAQLAEHPEKNEGKSFFLNISVPSVMESGFARFAKTIPAKQKMFVGFEIQLTDFFNNFDLTQNALNIIKNEGFKVAIDGVAPRVLPYMNLHLLQTDYIKINVAKDKAGQLAEAPIKKAIELMPREKLIFFRCDTEAAMMAGQAMGVTKFQGWLIDDYLHAAAL